jgi:hypothetical protein
LMSMTLIFKISFYFDNNIYSVFKHTVHIMAIVFYGPRYGNDLVVIQ